MRGCPRVAARTRAYAAFSNGYKDFCNSELVCTINFVGVGGKGKVLFVVFKKPFLSSVCVCVCVCVIHNNYYCICMQICMSGLWRILRQ